MPPLFFWGGGVSFSSEFLVSGHWTDVPQLVKGIRGDTKIKKGKKNTLTLIRFYSDFFFTQLKEGRIAFHQSGIDFMKLTCYSNKQANIILDFKDQGTILSKDENKSNRNNKSEKTRSY